MLRPGVWGVCVSADEVSKVRRRRVFYLPGFDPFPPRKYREIYRREGAAQAAISGYELALAPLAGRPGWRVTARIEDQPVEAEIEVLVWHDLVRRSMAGGIWASYRHWARVIALYVGSGAIFRLARLRKGPTIAALYPVVLLGLYLLAPLALVGALVAASGQVWLALPGLAAVPILLRALRRLDRRFYGFYLIHDYAFAAGARGATPRALQERLDRFADRIAAALAEDWDEVLVVGHSSGAQMAVLILDDLIRAGRVPGRAALALLTLGQVVPMVSFLPAARGLRGALRRLAVQDRVAWVDVTAPGDGCAFALCDPVAVSGVAPKGQLWPLVISAAFSQTLSPERWAALRWRFFRLHFQYLHAFDRPRDYDYFQITAGPCTLAARFAGRAPSPGRITQARSGYRDFA